MWISPFWAYRVCGCARARACRAGPVLERRVLAQDPRLEVAQLGPGLDPELVDEGGAQLAVCAQRVGLAPSAVQRQQALGPEPLTQRVPGGQRLEFCDRLPVASAHELRVHPRLEDAKALLLQPCLLRRGERKIAEVGQRRASPQSQRLVQEPDGGGRVPCGQRFTPAGRELLEPQHVQLAGRDSQDIARGRVTSRSASPADRSALRSSERRTCRFAAARPGARPGHNSSASRSADTTAFAFISSNASTARVRAPPTDSNRPPEVTSRGPRTWNSTLRLSSADARHGPTRPCEERIQGPVSRP